MFWFEANGFPDPEPGAVDGLEHNSMLEVVDTVQESADFFHGQHGWKFPAPRTRRQAEAVIHFPAAYMAVEIGDTGEIGLA